MVGRSEDRVTNCAPRITSLQAKCYLAQYADLQQMFGQNKNSWKQAQDHFYSHGFAEGRVAKCVNNVKKCADEGGQCECKNGRVFFGRRDAGNNGDELSFDDMLQYTTDRAISQEKVDCNNI